MVQKMHRERRPSSKNLGCRTHPPSSSFSLLFFFVSLPRLILYVLSSRDTANINETVTDEAIQSHYGPDTVMAVVTKSGVASEYKLSNVPVAEKLEKFMEDVK